MVSRRLRQHKPLCGLIYAAKLSLLTGWWLYYLVLYIAPSWPILNAKPMTGGLMQMRDPYSDIGLLLKKQHINIPNRSLASKYVVL
jgi:hypothetical protein